MPRCQAAIMRGNHILLIQHCEHAGGRAYWLLRCYNLKLAFCDEIKAYLTGYVRSGDTYTANGAAEIIKEIMAYLKDEGLGRSSERREVW